MKTLPLTVLFHEGPIGRAYLAMLRHHGYKPARIIEMVYDRDLSTSQRIARWMPYRAWRMAWAGKVQDIRSNYWARLIANQKPVLFNTITQTVSATYGLPENFYTELLGKPNYESYAERVDKILVSGISDSSISTALSEDDNETVLFTGGGIVPSALLKTMGKWFLHFHPGYLPNIRGADGLLWSTIVRGQPGVSAIRMDDSIDTGNILTTEDCIPLSFHVPDGSRYDNKTLYRALFAYYDPVLRANSLIRLLSISNDIHKIPSLEQHIDSGITYNFMHADLQSHALKRLFCDANRVSSVL